MKIKLTKINQNFKFYILEIEDPKIYISFCNEPTKFFFIDPLQNKKNRIRFKKEKHPHEILNIIVENLNWLSNLTESIEIDK